MKNLNKYLLTFILLLVFTAANAGKSRISPWSFGLAVGASNFLGEAGGTDAIGRDDFRDIKFNQTKFSGGLFANYRVTRWLHLGLNLYYARLSGADSLSANTGAGSHRYFRNSSFRNDLFESSLQAEFTIYSNMRAGNRYRLYGVKGRNKFNFRLYALAGVGYYIHNPKTFIARTGEWVELQPLGTEGQFTAYTNSNGVPISEPYKLHGINFPLGLGINIRVNNVLTIGYELSARYTLTDYLDDISGGPYLPDSLFNSQDAKDIVNRPKVVEAEQILGPGQGNNYTYGVTNKNPRGDAKNLDLYLYSLVKLSFKLDQSKKVRHRPKYEKRLRLIKPKEIKAKPKDNR